MGVQRPGQNKSPVAHPAAALPYLVAARGPGVGFTAALQKMHTRRRSAYAALRPVLWSERYRTGASVQCSTSCMGRRGGAVGSEYPLFKEIQP